MAQIHAYHAVNLLNSLETAPWEQSWQEDIRRPSAGVYNIGRDPAPPPVTISMYCSVGNSLGVIRYLRDELGVEATYTSGEAHRLGTVTISESEIVTKLIPNPHALSAIGNLDTLTGANWEVVPYSAVSSQGGQDF